MGEIMNTIDNIVKEIFIEASNGVVHVGDWRYFLRFYSNIEGNSNASNNKYPIVNIPNYNKFIKDLSSYLRVAYNFYKNEKDYFELTDKEYVKRLIVNLFVSATNYDLLDMYQYIDKRTKILTNNKIDIGSFSLGSYLNEYDVECKIVKNRSNEEGPYSFKVRFKKDDNVFELPEVIFSIIDNTAYVYGVQNKVKGKQDNLVAKKLDRYFRKVNKGIDANDDIYNVSPNALISFILFNGYLKNNGVNQLEASNFMPIRYHGNKVMISNKYKRDKYILDEALKMHDHNQYNITNKLMNLINRYSYHFSDCDTSYDDIKEVMVLRFNKVINRERRILSEIDNCIKNDKNITR